MPEQPPILLRLPPTGKWQTQTWAPVATDAVQQGSGSGVGGEATCRNVINGRCDMNWAKRQVLHKTAQYWTVVGDHL